eukprot:3657777-Pyramimonas_sp.AAC.1
MRWWEVGAGTLKERIFACSRCGGLGTDHYRTTGKLMSECQAPHTYGSGISQGARKRTSPRPH